jgi:flagellar biosynthesis/type III secretory pathway protein FliH
VKSSSEDGGGKKSLSNFDKKSVEITAKKIQLHYFPDIPVKTTPPHPGSAGENNSFKRIHFESRDPSRSDIPESIDDSDPGNPSLSSADIEKKAYQKGFLEGEKAAFDSHAVGVASAVQSMNRAIAEIRRLSQEIYQSIEREVVELALSIARKVVCQEIKINRDVVLCVAREALSQVDVPGKIKVRLNPADLEFITSIQGQNSNFLQEMDRVTFEAEESISNGGCVIETQLGEIDARIEKQLQVVEEKFRTEFASSRQKTNSEENP